jgi:hypothetical protein
MSTVTPISTRRELAHRASAGLEVTLYWRADDETTTIEIWRPATEELVIFGVAPEHALDAFYHPFAHLQVVSDHLISVVHLS